jgi:tetratricopeptide (TPR) repeat protein
MKNRLLLLFCLLLGFNSGPSASGSSGFFAGAGSNPSKEGEQKVYSKNAQANELYIEGLEYLNKSDPRIGGSIQNAQKAKELFREAAEKDPQFALAYIGQSKALEISSFSVAGATASVDIYRQQEAFALKASELDDSLPQAHSLLAEIYYDNEYDWAKAEKELKRVIELTPNAVVAHTRYGLFLGTMGRFEEAEAQARLAQTIDEKSAVPNRALLRIFYWERKHDAAIAQGLEGARKDKDDLATHFFLGLVYTDQGKFEKGIEEMKLAVGLGDAGSLAGLAYAYAKAGDKPEVENTLEQFKRHPSHDLVPYRLAAVYAALGDKDRAIGLLEDSYQQRNSWANWLKIDPAMDPLRQEPRFKELMRKMNFE